MSLPVTSNGSRDANPNPSSIFWNAASHRVQGTLLTREACERTAWTDLSVAGQNRFHRSTAASWHERVRHRKGSARTHCRSRQIRHMNATLRMAEFITAGQPTEEARRRAATALCDTVGVILAGAAEPAA